MNGIVIAETGKRITDDTSFFKSDKDTIKLDVTANPPHADFYKYTFGNNPAVGSSVGVANNYELLTVYHNLGYRPPAIVYFYNYDLQAAYSGPNSYQIGGLTLTAAGQNDQYFRYGVDSKKLTIQYVVGRAIAAATITYDVTGYSFGFKYFIYSNDTTS